MNALRDGESGGREPAINLPPVTLWLIIANVAIHAVRELLLSADDDYALVEALAFVPLRYSGDPDAMGGSLLATIVAPLTFQFLHAGWVHLGINVLTIAAFGSPLERVLRGRLFLLFYLLCGVLAAAGHLLFNIDSNEAVIGASGGISGLFGGMLMMLGMRGNLLSILPVVAIVIAMQVALGITGTTPGAQGMQVAWEAHVAGLLAGLGLIRPFLRWAHPRP